MPLHTTHRPASLDEIIGNESVVDSLKSVLAREKDKPHSYLFTGISGGGKCVTGDTFLFNNKGLHQFSDYNISKDGFSQFETKIGSFDTLHRTSHYFKERAYETIKIKNSLGLTLQGTPEHPILIYNRDGFQFKPLNELTTDDYSCTPRGFEYFNNENCKINFEYTKLKHDNTSTPLQNIPTEINADLARLLGYIIANGSDNCNGISLSTLNQNIIDDVKNILGQFGQKIGKQFGPNFPLGRKQFGEFLNYLLGVEKLPTARYKSIPIIILNSSKEIQFNFIQGLLDCDSYGRDGIGIYYYTASPILAKQVQLLLLNIGICATHTTKYLKEQDWVYHTIQFFGESIDIYMNKVGSLKYKDKFTQKKRNTNTDIIPYLKDILCRNAQNIRTDLRVNKAGSYLASNGKYKRCDLGKEFLATPTKKATYAWLNIALTALQNTNIQHNLVNKNIELIKQFQKLNFFYSPIVNVEIVKDPIDVYDFTIPEEHHFITNGYISHNSTLARILKTELGCSDSDYYLYNASNTRGIDSIRDIQDTCQFAPMNGKIKLFHMEECHMWTPQAMESILVLLEEPPDHVYFVLCTTEPDKLKPTIKRRCHSYEVKPLNTIQLNKLINRTLQSEGVTTFPEEVIQKIISVCDGSPGKALNLLDTVIDLSDDEQAFKAIDEATVSESNIAEIARMLLSGRGQWQSIAKMIDGLSGEPESLRYAFLGYFSKVLLNSKPGQEERISEIMLPFMDSIMYSGKGGLIMEIYFAFRASKI